MPRAQGWVGLGVAIATLTIPSEAFGQCSQGPGVNETARGAAFTYSSPGHLHFSAGTGNNDTTSEIEECWTGVQAEGWIEDTFDSDYQWDQEDAEADVESFGTFCGIRVGESKHWYTWEKWDSWPFTHHTEWEHEGEEDDETDVDCGPPCCLDSVDVEASSDQNCLSGPAECRDGGGERETHLLDTLNVLLIDLDGNGIRTSSRSSGVLFDVDGDGVRERVGWTAAGSDDALLAIDLNRNGIIDHGGELIGSAFAGSETGRVGGGFDALVHAYRQAGRKNKARLDSQYPLFTQLILWQDANRDGRSQRTELRTLSTAGVTSIALGYRRIDTPDGAGNVLLSKGRAFLTKRGVNFPRDLVEVQLQVLR